MNAPARRRPASSASIGLVCLTTALLLTGCGSARHRSGDEPPSQGPLQAGSHEQHIDVGGVARSFRTYVPATYDAAHPAALVVMIHGGFGSAAQAERAYGWDELAAKQGFVVAFPNGDGRAWNAGTCCGRPSKDGVDDVGFITAMVGDIRQRIAIDPRRIYVAGMSNGAMMAQRLACETNLFSAMASVAGAQMVPCHDPKPLSVLHIHGTADTHVPLDGSPGNGAGKVPAHTPVATSIEAWRTLLGCGSPTETVRGSVTTTTATCPEGRTVELILVAGAGHQWPGGAEKRPMAARLVGADQPSQALDATATIWKFFEDHPAPA